MPRIDLYVLKYLFHPLGLTFYTVLFVFLTKTPFVYLVLSVSPGSYTHDIHSPSRALCPPEGIVRPYDVMHTSGRPRWWPFSPLEIPKEKIMGFFAYSDTLSLVGRKWRMNCAVRLKLLAAYLSILGNVSRSTAGLHQKWMKRPSRSPRSEVKPYN